MFVGVEPNILNIEDTTSSYLLKRLESTSTLDTFTNSGLLNGKSELSHCFNLEPNICFVLLYSALNSLDIFSNDI